MDLFSYIATVTEKAIRDSAVLYDDVAVLTKSSVAVIDDLAAASKKVTAQAAGVVIDDAAASTGLLGESKIRQEREYIVWGKITLGSFFNKTVLSGIMLTANAISPIIPSVLLALGGGYLAYEGFHKASASFSDHKAEAHEKPQSEKKPGRLHRLLTKHEKSFNPIGWISRRLGTDPTEKKVITELLTLDAVLAAEIILVSMGGAAALGFGLGGTAVMLGVSSAFTTGLVYGAVLAGLRSDNIAKGLGKSRFAPVRAVGQKIKAYLPSILDGLSIVGTYAMLKVGGEILAHKALGVTTALGGEGLVHGIEHGAEAVMNTIGGIPLLGSVAEWGAFIGCGLAAGAVIVASAGLVHKAISRLTNKMPAPATPAPKAEPAASSVSTPKPTVKPAVTPQQAAALTSQPVNDGPTRPRPKPRGPSRNP